MNSSSSNPPPPTPPGEGSGKKVRKPYTITKSRESWTDEEHDKFLEALQLFDRDWKKIEDFVASKTVIQIRSHAQKYFLKVQKNGTTAHVPPPRPKRKAVHPYPQKAPKNVLIPLHGSVAYPSSPVSLATLYPMWDDASMLAHDPSSGVVQSENEGNILEFEADNGLKVAANASNFSTSDFVSTPTMAPSSDLSKQSKQDFALHGIPDFAEVYGFIGSVFDPESTDHMHKLKEMDPINFETVLLLMRNLTVNLSNPDFEPIRNVLSSYESGAKTVNVSAGTTVISAE